MPRLVYLAAARRDFEDIFKFIARRSGSVKTGRDFVDTLRQECRKLASLPGTLGPGRPELHADIRSFPFRGYVIFFRYGPNTFEVVNVIEGHRDLIAHFHRDPSP